MDRIPYVKPSITALEIDAVAKAAASGWGEQSNKYISDFETEFASLIGAEHAVATSSCTGALHLGLVAIGAKAGDEVILADTNWVATLAPILYLGAIPIFVDINEDDWCMNVEEVESKINHRTKAIIATHLYGNFCDLTELRKLAKRFDVRLIEDAAEAIGTLYDGVHVGTMGDFGVFSFHGSKTITTGEGGMLVTGNPMIAAKVRTLNNHGRSSSDEKQFFPSELGFKYRMTNMQAAIGVAQIQRFDELVSRKRAILESYREKLQAFTGMSMNPHQENVKSGAWMPNVVFAANLGISNNELIAAFQEANIDARSFFHPLSTLDFMPNQAPKPIALSIASRSINLPSFHDISESQIQRVVDVLVSVYQSKANS